MTLALKHPLSHCAIAVDFVDVDFLVPASYREEVVGWRELEVGYAVAGYLAGWHFNIFACVSRCRAGSSRRRGLTEKRHVFWLCVVCCARQDVVMSCYGALREV